MPSHKYSLITLLLSLMLAAFAQNLSQVQNVFTSPNNYPARAVAYSPDGSLLAVALFDNTIKILDANSGREVASLVGHASYVDSIAFSPDDNFLASGSRDKTVKIWRTADFSLVTSLEHIFPVFSLAFSPSGNFLASGSAYRSIKIWDTTNFSFITSLGEHTHYVKSIAFSPSGNFLASGSADNTVKIWRTNDFSLVASLEEHTNWVNSVAFSPDGDFLASGADDNTIKIWRTSDFSLVTSLEEHTSDVWSVAFSPAGDFLASGASDNTVKIWHVNDSYSLHKTIAGVNSGEYWIPSVAFHPAGTSLAVANMKRYPYSQGVVSLWGTASRQAVFCPSGCGGVPPQANRYALVIGNSNYQQAPLDNPENDARAMSAALQRLGFQVETYYDLNFRRMREVVRGFKNKLSASDVALVYFAGHGAEVNGENYLIPTDAYFDSPDIVKDEALALSSLLESLASSRSQLNIVILDACRNNPFKGDRNYGDGGLAAVSDTAIYRDFISQARGAQGVLISFSTSPKATAADGYGNNSPYTAALLQRINTPNITMEEMFKDVRELVLQNTSGRQRPWENSTVVGDFYFVPRP